jgi:phosphoribosyl 1,2-cyclic phosphodiesterase
LPIYFQSLRSSSSGNCLALWTHASSIVIDCGIKVQRVCRELLDAHRRQTGGLDAVIVSHAHGDHMSYAALRVLRKEGIRVYGHRRVIRQLRERYAPEEWNTQPELRVFPGSSFEVGDFRVTPTEVRHAPDVPNFAFVITAHDGRKRRRIVVCTDFHDYSGLVSLFVDADFIFLEANHDLALLRLHPNPASAYHMNNAKSASLLFHAVRQSGSPPAAVMLGHLSEERNRRRLALGEVEKIFGRAQTRFPFLIDAAPAHKPSPVVEII